MGELILFFSIATCLALLFNIWNDPRGNQWQDMLQQLSLINSEIKSLKQRREEIVRDLGLFKVELHQHNKRIEELSAALENFKDEMIVFRDQVSETREKQIQLREILSTKRPVIRMTGPVPTRNVEPGPKKMNNKLGKGLKSILREV